MSAPRISQEELNKILGKKGYGIQTSISGGVAAKGTAITSKTSSSGEVSDAQCRTRLEPVLAPKASFRYTGRCTIRVKVYRKRLADPDGNVPKWHVDALRMSLLIKDDSAKEVDYYFEGQEKVERDEDERVEIVLEYTNAWFE